MPHILIYWTASILQCLIQFRKCHHVQIIETGSILHVDQSPRYRRVRVFAVAEYSQL